jgi:putative ABC transport system permease protein
MKYLRLIVKNAGRNKRRSVLTILSISAAIFLLAFMQAIMNSFSSASELTGAELRLIVRRNSLADAMPESYREKIAQVPGVVAICPANWFGGTYKEDKPQYYFAQFYVDAKTLFDVQSEYQISPAEKQAFQQERTAAIAGRKLAAKYGWKIGDVIELKGTFHPVNPQLTLRGTYTTAADAPEGGLFFHREYVEEALGRPGEVGTFRIKLDSPASAPGVMDAVDAMFKSSAAPTKTETEASFQASFVSMLGNVKGLITSVGLVVVFTISLIAANAMAMTARERFTEVAVMKALGFRPGLVLGLILSESVFIALIGGVLGTLGARLGASALPSALRDMIFLQNLRVSPTVIALSLGASILIGLCSGGIPAWSAARVRIVDGLRRVA